MTTNQRRCSDLHNIRALGKCETVCTLAIFFRMLDGFPLLLAANRDEHYDRPSAEPAVMGGNPTIVAGMDLRAGGTWLGVNDRGVVAGILNRRANGGRSPISDARSRGQFCLDLLGSRSLIEAHALLQSDRRVYNPFTLVLADRFNAWVAYNQGSDVILEGLPPGLHVFSSAAQFDLHSAKANRARHLFSKVALGDGLTHNNGTALIAAFQPVLADHTLAVDSEDPGDAICVHREDSGTVSSSILRLAESASRFEFFHCAGAPCRNAFGAATSLPCHEREG